MRVSFRLEKWLSEELDQYQINKAIKNRTEALHKYIKDLKLELAVSKADLKTLKDYKLQMVAEETKTQKRKCLYWKDELVTIEQCDECRTKKKIPLCPIAGKVVR